MVSLFAQEFVPRFSKEWWLSVGIALGLIVAVAGVVNAIARRYVRRLISRAEQQQRDEPDLGTAQRMRRTATVARLILSTFQALTLRITSIRAFDGTLNIVPNGNINVTSNKTRGWGRAIVDVRLTFDQDVEHVRTVLEDLFRDLAGMEPFATGLRDEPKVLGIVQLA